MLSQLAQPEPSASAAESWRKNAPEVIVSNKEINAADFLRFVVDRRYLPLEGGRILLRLLEKPVLQINPSTLECELLGWDIALPSAHVEEVQQEMARKFTVLFSKADCDQLTDQEKRTWLSILDRVDYTSFCVDRAAPHYLEGKLRRLWPDCYIDWSDGRTERLDRQAANSFSELRPGDTFGAFIKLGHNNKTLSAERVTVLNAA